GLLFHGWLRWGPLVLVWAAAITGITLKTIFFEDLAEWLGLSFYLTLGWFGVFTAILLVRQYGFTFIKPLFWGGLAYTVGGIMDFNRWLTILPGVMHPHELFHLDVLMGAIFHYQFVWQFAKGTERSIQACHRM